MLKNKRQCIIFNASHCILRKYSQRVSFSSYLNIHFKFSNYHSLFLFYLLFQLLIFYVIIFLQGFTDMESKQPEVGFVFFILFFKRFI